MKNRVISAIYRLLLFLSLFCALLFAFMKIQRYLQSSGTVKLTATNVSAIETVSASGIVAYLYDHYSFPANEITFTREVELKYCSEAYGCIQYKNNDGQWVDVDSLIVQPVHDAGRLVIKSLPGRVDYTIGMSCLKTAEDPLSFPCTMQYTYVSDSKFKYLLNAPYMEAYVYFQDNEHQNESDEFFIEFNLENCIVLHHSEEITGALRLFAWNHAESKAQESIWSRTGFIICSHDGSPCITDTFSGSSMIEDVTYPDKFVFTYANEISANMDGALSFRYGSHSSEYELSSEWVHLSLDIDSLEAEKTAQNEFLRTYLNWNDEIAWFSNETYEPNLKIESLCLDKSRITSFELNATVDEAAINMVSLFPNIKTFFVDNYMQIGVISFLLSIVSFCLPKPDSLNVAWPFASKKKGKYLKDK